MSLTTTELRPELVDLTRGAPLHSKSAQEPKTKKCSIESDRYARSSGRNRGSGRSCNRPSSTTPHGSTVNRRAGHARERVSETLATLLRLGEPIIALAPAGSEQKGDEAMMLQRSCAKPRDNSMRAKASSQRNVAGGESSISTRSHKGAERAGLIRGKKLKKS